MIIHDRFSQKPNIISDPLVSVVVIAFNSAKFIVETLESVKHQTYKNIELIISDDCSTDETVELCRRWIKINKGSFKNVNLLVSEKNLGISGNANRGFNAAQGEWIKPIAGDDAMFKDAVYSGMEYAMKHKMCSIFTSEREEYNENFNQENFIRTSKDYDSFFYKLDAKEQYKFLLFKNYVNAVGTFMKREVFIKVGGFDERFRYLDDAPMNLKITKHGYKFYFLNKVTVKYRIHNGSIRKVDSKKDMIFDKFYEKVREYRKIYVYPNISAIDKFGFEYEFYRHRIIDFLNLNKKNIFGRSVYFISGKLSLYNFRLNKSEKKYIT